MYESIWGIAMPPGINLDSFGLDYESRRFGSSLLIHADCFDWMGRLPANSFHAIVTDPPYGVKGQARSINETDE